MDIIDQDLSVGFGVFRYPRVKSCGVGYPFVFPDIEDVVSLDSFEYFDCIPFFSSVSVATL